MALRMETSWGQVDDDAIGGENEPAVHQGPFDAMDALLHRLLREADEDGLRQRRGRDVDLDLYGEGVDSQE